MQLSDLTPGRHSRHRHYAAFALLFLLISYFFSGSFLEFFVTSIEGPIYVNAAVRVASQVGVNPDVVVPVTLIEIDDATMESWAHPALTPPDKLAKLLEVVTRAEPAAVVVDVKLAAPRGEITATIPTANQAIVDFAAGYSGASPIVFVRNVALQSDGRLAARPSIIEDAVRENPRLSWAHAVYRSEEDGAVRRWLEWVEACKGDISEPLPAVPVRVLAVAVWKQGSHYGRPATDLRQSGNCSVEALRATSRFLIFSNPAQDIADALSGNGLLRVPAVQMLEPEIQRDDERLLRGRVVLIGNTHSESGDSWHTPVGEVAGVELIAQSIRFGGAQLNSSAQAERLVATGLLAVFVLAIFFLRPVLAGIVAILSTAFVIWTALRSFGFLSVLDSVESAIVLFVAFIILEETSEFVADWRVDKVSSFMGKRAKLWWKSRQARYIKETDNEASGS